MNTSTKPAPVRKIEGSAGKPQTSTDPVRTENAIGAHAEVPKIHTDKPAPALKAIPERAPLPPVVASANTEKPINAGVQAPIPGAVKHISPNGLSPIGYTRNSWDAIAARGVTLADVLVPEYWLHIAQQLRPNDKIEILCEDGTWWAQLFVINADRTWAKVHVLNNHDLTQARTNQPLREEDNYDVDWTPSGKWTITKKSQKGQPPLKDGFLSKLEALQWLDGHIKSTT